VNRLHESGALPGGLGRIQKKIRVDVINSCRFRSISRALKCALEMAEMFQTSKSKLHPVTALNANLLPMPHLQFLAAKKRGLHP